MLKKAITYQNLDGVLVTEEFHFQITKSEIAEKAVIEGDGFLESLQSLSVERDGQKIIDTFKKVLGEAVGKREGNLFLKNEAIRNNFMFSGAYDAFFMELLENPDSGASVIRAMLPADAQAQVDQAMKERGMTTVELPSSGIITDAEAQASKPQPEFPQPITTQFAEHADEPTSGPQTVSGVSSANAPQPGTNAEPSQVDEPAWLKESRSPTRQEMLKMSKEDIALAFKMREAGVIK